MTLRRFPLVIWLALAAVVAVVNATVLLGGRTRQGVQSAECALVLGNAVQDDGTPAPVLADRLEEALGLYQSGRVKHILVSGDERAGEPVSMRRWLEAHGVPASNISVDAASVDTYTSMWRAKHVFGHTHLVVVTQRFHLPRALWVARQVGMQAEGAEADRRTYPSSTWFEVREVLSRSKAFFDVARGRTGHA